MNVVYKALLIITVLLVQAVAYADWKESSYAEWKETSHTEWKVVTGADWLSNGSGKAAVVKNKDGHLFSIYRKSFGGQVWGIFSLSDNTRDQIDSEHPPIYRVDKRSEYKLSTSKNLDKLYGLNLYQWQPEQVKFVIWHGKEDEGVAGDIVDMVKGRTISFRYYLDTGGYKDTSFTLKGSASAISGAVNIDMNSAIDDPKNKR